MMDKTGEIRPGNTPDIEKKLPPVKAASAAEKKEQTKALDDDATGRLAKAASK